MLAVVEEEVLTVVEFTQPTPLPFAPVSVMGIASVQGRMFTVVNVASLVESEVVSEEPRFIVALRGDEQLALAVDNVEEVVEVEKEEVATAQESGLIQGKTKIGTKDILLLNIDELFTEMIRGQERRRRRL
jgi:purine-binding chemotaxis protein CheW